MGIPLYQSHGWGSKKNIGLAGKAAEGVISPLGRLVVWDKLPGKHPQKSVLVKYVKDYKTVTRQNLTRLRIRIRRFHDGDRGPKESRSDKSKIRDYVKPG